MIKEKSAMFHNGLENQLFSRAVRGGRSIVYCYLRESDGTPYYVGVASTSDRPASKYHATKPPRNRQYIRILRQGLTRNQAWEWEKFYIAHYGRKDIGTGILRNQSSGGEGNNGYRHTPESKARVSLATKGKKQSEDWVVKRTSQIRGENNGMYGKTHTAEAREKMSRARKGVKRGPMSEDARRKLSEARKGRRFPGARRKMTPEQVEQHRCRILDWHRQDRERRASVRGVSVEELLKLEKRERNQRSYANWKQRKQEAEEAA